MGNSNWLTFLFLKQNLLKRCVCENTQWQTDPEPKDWNVFKLQILPFLVSNIINVMCYEHVFWIFPVNSDWRTGSDIALFDEYRRFWGLTTTQLAQLSKELQWKNFSLTVSVRIIKYYVAFTQDRSEISQCWVGVWFACFPLRYAFICPFTYLTASIFNIDVFVLKIC